MGHDWRTMEASEVHKLAALEDTHWWYAERRHLLGTLLKGRVPGTALDVGAAGGGNTRVLVANGWRAVALEYGEAGARVSNERGIPTLRADATRLPVADHSLDLVVAFDILEHIVDDDAAVAEVRRVLRPDGTWLVAVPADPRLWSAHDVAVDHVRRYTRDGLVALLARGGFDVDRVWSWNVLLRPAAAIKRRQSSGSDLDQVHPVLNAGLRMAVAAERFLPVGNLPGVSLFAVVRPRSGGAPSLSS